MRRRPVVHDIGYTIITYALKPGRAMADYYPLIAKAVSGLNAQDRRALYERGRNALITELRAIRPRLSESVITKERLGFEEAIRQVESEADHRAQESG